MKKSKDKMSVVQPKEPHYTGIARDNATQPLESFENKYPDSVNEHKALEAANMMLNEGEISQQRNNN
ncbi:hypothetical protein ACWE42_22175 [Sutcliffiella cohnii]